MKHSDMGEKWKEKSENYIRGRWKQLNDLTREYTSYATKYCFGTNSGGAVALLSYFGVSKGATDLPNLKYAFCIFLIGIIFAAGPIMFLLHEFNFLLQGWRKDTLKFFDNEISYKELLDNDENREKKSVAAWVAGYISLACFIIGIFTAMWQFLLYK